MSYARRGEVASQCFYCDGLIADRGGEGDHFPVPKRHGGAEIVPCCVSCHDMKDRFRFDSWPDEWVVKVMADFPKLSRETRIFLAKWLALVCDEGRAKQVGEASVVND